MTYSVRTPDVDGVLLGRIRAALISAWPALIVAREKPATGDTVVTLTPAGGPAIVASLTGPALFEDARRAVNVWAPTEQECRDLEADVRGVVEAQHGQAPFHQVTAAGAVVINEIGEPPQRYFVATLTTRRD